MAQPYLFSTLLLVFLAVLASANAALTSFGVAPWVPGLVWLRVHFVTLGVLTQLGFALLPDVVAARSGLPKPKPSLSTWLVLNAGFVLLVLGVPIEHMAVMVSGGSLVFLAVLMLIRQLITLQPKLPRTTPSAGRMFYIASLAYLLIGIIIGSGLWFGIGPALGIATPVEAHIHANNWGFLALMFAGLLVDIYPDVSGHQFRWPRSVNPIFVMMVLGAALLVIAPWVGGPMLRFIVMPGIILHLGATAWLLLNIILPTRGTAFMRNPGFWHLVTSYTWIIAPVLVAPLVILQVAGFDAAGVERNAPQALVYGWGLQFGFAMVPYLFRRLLAPSQPATLGGSWFSLIAGHLGCIALWASIFAGDLSLSLHGMAYLLWFAALVPIAVEIWWILTRSTPLTQPQASN